MENNSKKGTNQKVRALSDREQARTKIAVFFGSRDTSGKHSVIETIANATDEISNNFEEGRVVIELSEDCRTISIEDTGRGINIDEVDDNGTPYYELLFTTLFAGSKYDDTLDSYTTGLNGVGSSVICLTSIFYECVSKRNGKIYRVQYKNGGEIINGLEVLGNTEAHGSKFTFTLDETIHNDYLLNPEWIKDLLNKQASINNNIEFNFIYKGEEIIFKYNSMLEYYNSCFTPEISFEQPEREEISDTKEGKEKSKINVILGIGKEVRQEAYLNGTFLKEGGSINEGVIEGVKLFVNKYCKDNAMYNKNEKNITFADIENSLSFMVKYLSTKVEFCNQTKFSTKKQLYKEIAKKYIKEQLEIISLEKEEEFKQFVNKILVSKRANEKASAVLSDVKKRLEKKLTAKERIAIKNYMSAINDEGDADLYVVEGGSAGGGVISARLKESQAIFSIKGKSLNVSKKDITKILKNEEIMNLFTLLGCGIEYNGKKAKNMPVFNIDKLRFRHIYLFADSDEDGKAVRTLLVNVFNTLAPELIKQGRVRVIYAPLYIYSTKEKDYYIYDERDKGELEDKLKNDGIRYTRKRFKGIGSLNSRELHESTMNNPNRPEIVLTLEDAEKTNELLDNWFTDGGLQYRKDSIIKYTKEFKISDLE